jgi:hypothetical protein
VPLLAILGVEICLGLAIVGHMKIVFLAHAESTRVGLATWFVPFYALGFVARRWEDTRGPFLAHTAGVAGLILWCVFVPPYLKGGGRPGAPGGSYVALIVAGVPDDDARGVIQDEIKALADRSGVTESRGEVATGRPDRYLLAPVRDPGAFARRVTFGTVTSVRGRDIYVTAAPVSPEAVAARRARRAGRDAGRGRDGPDAEGREDLAAGPGASAEPGPPADADAVTRALFGPEVPGPRPAEGGRPGAHPAGAAGAGRRGRRGAAAPARRRGQLPGRRRHPGAGACERPRGRARADRELPDQRHRNEAIKALGARRDPRAIGPMLAYLETSGFQVADALRRMGPAAEPALLERLGDPDPDVRREACMILQGRRRPATLAFMQAARPDPDGLVRLVAQGTLRAIAARVGGDAGADAPRPLTEGPPSRPGRRAPR